MSKPRPLDIRCSSSLVSRQRRGGFALLITITLLAFLVLLLVSLASLTRVETQVASNSQQLLQARQNALMGLNVALGRLQAAAGPDTRITATADLVSGRDINKKNWTGVWNAAAAGTDKNIAWLVSGTAPAGAAGVTTPLPTTGNALVELVGAGSTDITATATTGNQVRVETQPITSAVAGLLGTPTVGNFAYWVGDEGVKAKVTLTDPWESPTAATLAATAPPTSSAQAQSYRFINAQRTGIEGVDAAAGTKLGTAYPATDATFKEALPKILALSQLPLANTDSAGQTALTLAQHNRFHDLTASSYSLLTDVVKGGFKKDLTAWIADTTSNPAGSAIANDDYITQGDSSDTTKYGLPKWELIRNYATTLKTGAAVAPRQQTPSQQGIYPVMTYARIGYNITCPAGGGIYKINIMPVIALWNPYNVPLATSTFEFCFKYTTTSTVVTAGNYLNLVIYAGSPNPTPDAFNLSNLNMGGISYGSGTGAQFWRFKVQLSKALAPGESRLFTITDAYDDTKYAGGQSTLSDAIVAPNNAVYIPSKTPLTSAQMSPTAFIFWNTEYGSGTARMEFLLTKPVPISVTDPTAIEGLLRSEAYQTFLGNGFDWNWETNPNFTIPASNNGKALVYQRIELAMSTLSPAEGYGSTAGTPRWLAELNPQSSVFLRNPASNSSITPSYLREQYIQNPSYASPGFVYKGIPNADGTNVSAGTRVSTTGTAQNLVIREFQPAGTPLFSLAQLQHANLSSLNINPAYPVGNSLPNLYVPRDDPNAQYPAAAAADLPNDIYPGFPNGSFKRIYDLSYLLNKTLWDGYFFSTVPTGLTAAQAATVAYQLPNARLQFHWNTSTGAANAPEFAELKATGTAAAHLLINGGFNVNSTSEQAWRALLYSHNGVASDPSDPAKKHPYSRLTSPADPTQPNSLWQGYRILSDTQIDSLAKTIVAEVRTRGPFLSLADFVNRRLAADATGLKGALQAAIDATTTGSDSGINGGTPFNFSSMPVTDYPSDINSDAERKAVYLGGTDSTQPSASRAAFAPGYLTQADLLTAIGASLTARSDTFRIRAYGETVNPATGAIEGKAWCEAIVQRQLDYLDASANAATVPPSSATTLNQTFGRRFKITSFRWLSPNDI